MATTGSVEDGGLDFIMRAAGLRPSSPTNNSTIIPFTSRRAAPYPFENNVSFLAISVGTVTTHDLEQEVIQPFALGCAVLDTENLARLPPGVDGSEWYAETQSGALRLSHRQSLVGAASLTASCPPNRLSNFSEQELKEWMTGSISLTRRGNLVIITDNYKGRLKTLEDDLGLKFKDMPGVVGIVLISDLYEKNKPPGAPRAGTLAATCEALGVPCQSTVEVLGRAESVLGLTLAITLRAAASSTPTGPAVPAPAATITPNAATPQTITTPPARVPTQPLRDAAPASRPATPVAPAPRVIAPSSRPAALAPQVVAPPARSTPPTPQAVAPPPQPAAATAPRVASPAQAESAPVRRTPATTTTPSPANAGTTGTRTATTANPLRTPATATANPATVPVPAPANTGQPRTAQPTTAPANARPVAPGLAGHSARNNFPVPLPSGYNSYAYIPTDNVSIILDRHGDQIEVADTSRPARIDKRVRRYTELTQLLEQWLIDRAREYDHPMTRLQDETEMHRDDHGERRVFVTPTMDRKGCVSFAQHIKGKARIPSHVQTRIQDIIDLRSFVSDWYDDLRVKKGFLETCGIQKKTENHRAFAAMLVRVRDVLSPA